MNTKNDIYALHRYFLWANRMRVHCEDSIEEQGPPPSPGPELLIWLSAPFAYACYWFASLYVVIEGLQELNLTSPTLSALLSDGDKLDKLRRFRNGVYHYQKSYFDDRTRDFLAATYLEWARHVHEEVSHLFMDWFSSIGLNYDVLALTDERIRIALKNANGDDLEIDMESIPPDVDE